MKIHKGNVIFVSLAITLLILFIGFDYIKYTILESNPRYTVAVVTEFKEYGSTYNNRIKFTYNVDGKQYTGKYRSGDLPTNLKGKRIVIKFSNTIRRWNYPFYMSVVPDSVQPPTGGWNSISNYYY